MLLNDGSKHINVTGWRKNVTLPQRVETSRRRSRRCLLMSLALAKTSEQQVSHSICAFICAFVNSCFYVYWFGAAETILRYMGCTQITHGTSVILELDCVRLPLDAI